MRRFKFYNFLIDLSKEEFMTTFSSPEQAEKRLQNYKTEFRGKAVSIADKPVSKRQCNDLCCLVFFILFFGSFVGYSAYCINTFVLEGDIQFQNQIDGSALNGVTNHDLRKFAIIIFSCFGGALFISLVFCVMLCNIPQITIYIMAGSGVVAIFGLAIFLVIQGHALGQFSSYFFMVGIFYGMFICILREYLEKAAILMKTVVIFVKDNVKILGIVAFSLIYCLVVVVLWGLGYYSFLLLYSRQEISYGSFVGSSIFWAFLLVFFNFYFYYTSVFLTSYSLAIWFYQKQDMDSLGTPLKHMVAYHLGTITFASLIISVLRFIRIFLCLALFRGTQGVCGLIGFLSACISFCVMGALQPIIQVLNTYAIVTCALTGQSFIDAGVTAAHVGFQDSQAFDCFSFAGHVVQIGASICISSIPTIVGTILISTNVNNDFLTMIGSLLLMFVSSIIGQVILQIFLQSIHTIFMMYRLDTELQEAGAEVIWVQEFAQELNKGFDEAFVGNIKKKPKPKYKKVTTVIVHQNGITEVHRNRVQVGEQQSNGPLQFEDLGRNQTNR